MVAFAYMARYADNVNVASAPGFRRVALQCRHDQSLYFSDYLMPTDSSIGDGACFVVAGRNVDLVAPSICAWVRPHIRASLALASCQRVKSPLRHLPSPSVGKGTAVPIIRAAGDKLLRQMLGLYIAGIGSQFSQHARLYVRSP
jgi:hypothetical protein